MANDNKKSFDEIKPGTNCGKIFFTALFFCIALLFMLIGFWKTIFIALFSALGYFIGSSKDVKGDVSKFVNKVVPQEKKVEPSEKDKEIFNEIKSSSQEPEAKDKSTEQPAKKEEAKSSEDSGAASDKKAE